MPMRLSLAFRRQAGQWMGWALILPGLVVLVLPIPLGLVMIALGLTLAARHDPWLQNAIRALRGRFPGLSRRLNGLGRYLPYRARRLLVLTDPARRRR